jgi:hypothetical protein
MLFRRRLAGLSLVLVLLSSIAARAQVPFKAEGLGPDAELTGGGGLGIGGKLENPFLARVRVGALYAHQPWIANLGVTLELGALGRFGLGGEFELNFGRGFFGNVGVARVEGNPWMSHVGVGFMIFGLEWQHRYARERPRDALMLFVRMPLGIWWLRKRQEDAAEALRTRAVRASVGPRPAAADEPLALPPSAAEAPAPIAAEDANKSGEVAAALDEARGASERGEHALAALALARAYALRPDGQILLQLSAAEEGVGRWRAAASDLQRALSGPGLSTEDSAAATRHLAELKARMPQLRLTLDHAAGDEQLMVDGALEPSATLGYDVPLDPGPHTITIVRNGVELARREVELSAGALTRLQLDLPH